MTPKTMAMQVRKSEKRHRESVRSIAEPAQLVQHARHQPESACSVLLRLQEGQGCVFGQVRRQTAWQATGAVSCQQACCPAVTAVQAHCQRSASPTMLASLDVLVGSSGRPPSAAKLCYRVAASCCADIACAHLHLHVHLTQ